MSVPIPIPFRQRLRDLRVRLVPVVMFVSTVVFAGWLWRDTITPAAILGEVTSAQSTVTSPTVGLLQQLKVRRFDSVHQGDVIAEIHPEDARQALNVLQGEIGLFKAKTDADATQRSQDRMALDFEKLSLDLMTEKLALVIAQAKAKKTAMDLDVARGLVSDPTQSQRFLQEAQLAKEAADAELKERQTLVSTLAKRVDELSTVTTSASEVIASLTKTVDGFETRLRDIEKSQTAIPVRAPINGMVTTVLHRAGENVRRGDPLVIITSAQPESIVGYLRQPMSVEPTVGQPVEVRSRDRHRSQGTAYVTRVGVQFEPIVNLALQPGTTTPVVGLPVEISLPSGMKLRPGELVSLLIQSPATLPQ
jgi:multidrug resistance efflux pump